MGAFQLLDGTLIPFDAGPSSAPTDPFIALLFYLIQIWLKDKG